MHSFTKERSVVLQIFCILCSCAVLCGQPEAQAFISNTTTTLGNSSYDKPITSHPSNHNDIIQVMSCGNGESLSFYFGTTSCCSVGTVATGTYSVGTGTSDSAVEFWIARGTTSTVYTASLCRISNSGRSCTGSACRRRGSKYDCDSPTIRASTRMCARYKCNNWFSTCRVSSFRVTFRASFTYLWLTSAWGTCSSGCRQTRTVTCRRSDGTTVSDSFCSGTKPVTSQSCTGGSCTHSWQTGSWGACSSSCSQSRSVTCRRSDGTTVSDSFCSGTKPTVRQTCTGGLCAPAQSPPQTGSPPPPVTDSPPQSPRPIGSSPAEGVVPGDETGNPAAMHSSARLILSSMSAQAAVWYAILWCSMCMLWRLI